MNDNAKKWIKALRSGEFLQGEGYLKQIGRHGDPEHCCLGVACELYIRDGGRLETDENPAGEFTHLEGITVTSYMEPMESKGAYTSYLPPSVQEWLGLQGSAGNHRLPEDEEDVARQATLASMNDSGRTFEEIADRIEAEPEDLFF